MMILKRFQSLFPCFFLVLAIHAQEMNFAVKVVNPQNKLVDPKVMKTLETAIFDLVNTTKWTDDIFEQNERITGNIQLTIKMENSPTSFTAEMLISATRPIYGTDATTPLFTHFDREINFSYEQFQPLQYVQNAFGDNLTASIAYYVYVILGMDYDSYALQGGETYLQKAQDIYNTVPTGPKSEWQGKELGNQNRYWFIENLLSPRLKNFRQANYEYHRLGLDVASTDANKCKTAILASLDHIDEAQQTYPNTRAIRTFAATKTDEMIEIFKNGSAGDKQRFIQIMTRLDPSNASRFTAVGY